MIFFERIRQQAEKSRSFPITLSPVVYPSPIQSLIDLFTTFPGVGPRQAARFVFHVLNESSEFRHKLTNGIASLKELLLTCARCGNVEAKRGAEKLLCSICTDKKRDQNRIAIVEEVVDLRAIEQTRSYNGIYHVLAGALSAKKDTDATILRVKKILERIAKELPDEIIIATSPTSEGELTARYLERELAQKNVKFTRLARGLARGVDIEYVDQETLRAALSGRK